MTDVIDREPVTIADVDREMAVGVWWGRFAPAIERMFHADTVVARRQTLVVSGICAVVLYDIFLLNDWLTLRDMFAPLVLARLAIFTPLVIAVLWTIGRTTSSTLHDALAAIVATVAVLLPMTLLVFSNSAEKASYQYGTLIVMMFVTMIQRVRFRLSVVALLVILAIQAVTTSLGTVFSDQGYSANLLFFGSVSVLLMLSSFIVEQQERRSYLFALRGRLLFDEVERAARTDALTGLFNRRHLAACAAELASGPQDSTLSLVLLDIDHFKALNDSVGHLAGDQCLATVAGCVMRVVGRRGGLAFRFGGEEFLVLLKNRDLAATHRTAEAIAAELRRAAMPHPAGSVVTVSIGLSGPAPVTVPLDDMIAAADAALYRAKAEGRDLIWPPRADEAGIATRHARAADRPLRGPGPADDRQAAAPSQKRA